MAAAHIENLRVAWRQLLRRMNADLNDRQFPQERQQQVDAAYRPSFYRIVEADNINALYRDGDRYPKRLRASEEFRTLLAAVNANERLAVYYFSTLKLGTLIEAGQRELQLSQHAISTYADFRRATEGAADRNAAVDQYVDSRMSLVLGNLVRRVVRCPLTEVAVDAERIDLDARNCLRRVIEPDRERWHNGSLELTAARTSNRHFELGRIGAVFESYQETPEKYLYEPGLTIEENRFRTVTSLIFDNDVDMSIIDLNNDLPRTRNSTASVGMRVIPQFGQGGQQLHFNADRAAKLVELWNAIQRVENNGRYSLACRRWILALVRSDVVDRLIDLWIAIEGLFSPGMDGELRFRMSLRAAAFLGGTVDETAANFKMLMDSYSVRSKVVHGDHVDVKEEDVDALQVIVQHVLLEIIRQGSFDPSKIDASIIEGYAKSLA